MNFLQGGFEPICITCSKENAQAGITPNCCGIGGATVEAKEATALVALQPALAQAAGLSPDHACTMDLSQGCKFWTPNDFCLVYPERPGACRDFPQTNSDAVASGLGGRYSNCPALYFLDSVHNHEVPAPGTIFGGIPAYDHTSSLEVPLQLLALHGSRPAHELDEMYAKLSATSHTIDLPVITFLIADHDNGSIYPSGPMTHARAEEVGLYGAGNTVLVALVFPSVDALPR